MSQSNKSKKTLYILIIFTIICIGITTACIYNTLQIRENAKYGQVENKPVSNLFDKTNENVKNIEPIEITAQYSTNGITKENIQLTDGKLLHEYENTNNYDNTDNSIYEYRISYEKISGLKNITVQNKINKEIEDTTLALKNKLIENPEYSNIIITSWITGNFSDVLSVNINYSLIKHDYSYENSDYENKYDFIGLNYRLDTGEKLEFSDLFMDNASIKSIIEQASYESLAYNHNFETDEYNDLGEQDFNNTNYGYIENQVFKIVSAYNRNPNMNFYFTEKDIFFNIKDFDVKIKMEDFYEDIAIYTAFRENDLYSDNSIRKEFYPFVHTYFIDSIVDSDFKGDNFYYEILTYSNKTEENKDIHDSIKNVIQEKVEYYYELAKQNPERAYIFSIIYVINEDPNDSKVGYFYHGEVGETDINYFKDNAKSVIASAQREERPEVWCIDYSYYDENIEFYEQVTKTLEDYKIDDKEETVFTKADREVEEMGFAEGQN